MRRLPFLPVLLLLSAFSQLRSAPQTPATQPTTYPTLLILSKAARTLSLVDPVTLRVLAAVPVGPDPHEVAATPDGRFAYVSDYGFGRYHTLSVVDLVHYRALPPIELGALTGPHGLSSVGGFLWFTAEGAKAIARFNPSTHRIDQIVGTGQDRTHMLLVLPSMQRIFATNVNSGTLSVLDRTMQAPGTPPPGFQPPPGFHPAPPIPQWHQTVIPVGLGDEGFDLSPDGGELWTANAQDGSISIVDPAALRVIATLRFGLTRANRLKFTPDGRFVLVSRLNSGNLTVLDVRTRSVVRLVPVGHAAEGILISPDGSRAFIACSPDNNVAVLDLRTFAIVARIHAGGDPDGMAWASSRFVRQPFAPALKTRRQPVTPPVP